ncbi:MAG: DNA gyrase inhibitor YacG [Thermoguttaceae bacterium]|nr:DNA gyrase inhibitor YacG [Thermoguttaceae bacterium]
MSGSARLRRCPICGRPFDLDNSPAPPFCSARCKLIDLGRWLDEKYGLPYERKDPADRPAPPAEGDEPD